MENPDDWWKRLKQKEDELEYRKTPAFKEKIGLERELRKIAKKELKEQRKQRSIARGKVRNVKPKREVVKVETPIIRDKNEKLLPGYIGPYYEIPSWGLRSDIMKVVFPHFPESRKPPGLIIKLEEDIPEFLLKEKYKDQLEGRARIKVLERQINIIEKDIERKFNLIDKAIERSGYYERLEEIKRERQERKKIKKESKEIRKQKSIARGKIRK